MEISIRCWWYHFLKLKIGFDLLIFRSDKLLQNTLFFTLKCEMRQWKLKGCLTLATATVVLNLISKFRNKSAALWLRNLHHIFIIPERETRGHLFTAVYGFMYLILKSFHRYVNEKWIVMDIVTALFSFMNLTIFHLVKKLALWVTPFLFYLCKWIHFIF